MIEHGDIVDSFGNPIGTTRRDPHRGAEHLHFDFHSSTRHWSWPKASLPCWK